MISTDMHLSFRRNREIDGRDAITPYNMSLVQMQMGPVLSSTMWYSEN